MELTDEDRKYILNEFLRLISHVANEEYQRRIWIRAEGPECDDFDETVCHFFDDGDPILKKYKDYGITENQYQLLMKFRDAFNKFSDEHDLPQEFISSPEWKRITEMAKEILQAFNYPENPT